MTKSIYDKTTCSIQELAQEIGIGLNGAYRLANEPGFPVVKIGRRKLVLTAEFRHWMQKRASNQNAC